MSEVNELIRRMEKVEAQVRALQGAVSRAVLGNGTLTLGGTNTIAGDFVLGSFGAFTELAAGSFTTTGVITTLAVGDDYLGLMVVVASDAAYTENSLHVYMVAGKDTFAGTNPQVSEINTGLIGTDSNPAQVNVILQPTAPNVVSVNAALAAATGMKYRVLSLRFSDPQA